jgi:hypothetical protein
MAEKLDFKVLGSTGLKEYGGLIYEEFMRKLQGPYAQRTYREMTDNSSTIGSVMFIIEALVRQVDWRVEPSSKVKEAEEQAEFVDSCIQDMNHTLEDFISETLSFLNYGWAYFEVVYKLRKGQTNNQKTQSKYDDGKIGWRKFALRAQDTLDRWEFNEDEDLMGMHQLTEKGKQAYIPIEKAVLFRTKTIKDNPEGKSIFRNAVIDWYYLKRIGEIEAIGIERDFAGLPVMQVPISLLQSSASDDAVAMRRSLEKMLAQIKRDERDYAIIPPELDSESKPTGYKFSLLSSGGSRQIDTNATKTYYKINILQSVSSQFIQLGMSNVGSFALVSNQTNMFSVALGAYLDVITSTFNQKAIEPLMKLNNVDSELWPKLVHGDIEAPPLDEFARYIQTLSMSGKLPDTDAIDNKLLEMAGLPIPNQEEREEMAAREEEERRAVQAQQTQKKRGPLRGLSAPMGDK